MTPLIKVCGMIEGENIRNVEEQGVDMIGFIFYPHSPRYLCKTPGYLPARAKRVGVFVNESRENIRMYACRFGLDYIQLHGTESPGYCHSLQANGLRLIKAFSVSRTEDLLLTSAYNGLCDYFLFDTQSPGYGGSGNCFDWNLLHSYSAPTPFLLSGGIHPYSAKAIQEFRHSRFAGIDLNSRFETAPGIKEVERIETFLRELKRINHKL